MWGRAYATAAILFGLLHTFTSACTFDQASVDLLLDDRSSKNLTIHLFPSQNCTLTSVNLTNPTQWLSITLPNTSFPVANLSNSVDVILQFSPLNLSAGSYSNVVAAWYLDSNGTLTNTSTRVTLSIPAALRGDILSPIPSSTTSSVTLTEGIAGTLLWSLHLSSRPASAVTVQLQVQSSSTAAPYPYWTMSPANGVLVFDATNYANPQTVALAINNDLIASGRRLLRLSFLTTSSDSNYSSSSSSSSSTAIVVVLPAAVDVTVDDDDQAGFVVSPSPVSVLENVTLGIVFASIRLTSQPMNPFILSLLSTNELKFRPEQLTFNSVNWNQTQNVSIAAIDDNIASGRRRRVFNLVPRLSPSPTPSSASDPAYSMSSTLIARDGRYNVTVDIDDDVSDWKLDAVFPGKGVTTGDTVLSVTIPSERSFFAAGSSSPSYWPDVRCLLLDSQGNEMNSTQAAVKGAQSVECLTPACLNATLCSDVTIALSGGGQISYNALKYSYYAAPIITRIDPSVGNMHQPTIVTIYGQGFFSPLLSYCLIEQKTATAQWDNQRQALICTAPARPDLEANTRYQASVQVTLNGQQPTSTSSSAIFYYENYRQQEADRFWQIVLYSVLSATGVFALYLTWSLGKGCCCNSDKNAKLNGGPSEPLGPSELIPLLINRLDKLERPHDSSSGEQKSLGLEDGVTRPTTTIATTVSKQKSSDGSGFLRQRAPPQPLPPPRIRTQHLPLLGSLRDGLTRSSSSAAAAGSQQLQAIKAGMASLRATTSSVAPARQQEEGVLLTSAATAANSERHNGNVLAIAGLALEGKYAAV